MPLLSRFVRYAPKGAGYLLAFVADNLPKARRFQVAAPLSVDDGGEGGDYTVSVGGASSSTRGVVKLAGQLGGSADAPDVRGLRTTSGGGTLLALGAVANGQVFARDGDAVVGLAVVPAGGGAMSGDLAMGGHKVTGLATGSEPGDAATYGQLTSMLNGLDWQAGVVDAVSSAPGNPSDGQRFLVTGTPSSGDPFFNQGKKIAQRAAGAWSFVTPNKGFTVHNDATGQDLTYDGDHPGGNWVNIGASVDHASLLNLDGGDPHPQYQLASQREAQNGYAGLGQDSLPLRPTKGVRTGGDPQSPAPGEVWVVGFELKFRNDTGTPATEIVERQARRNQANGYAGLDSNGRVEAAHAPAKATYSTGGDQAMAPADIGAAPSTRSVATGTGLAGGGNLSADRTISIVAFTGVVSKDVDPTNGNYAQGAPPVVVLTVDAGADGMLVPFGLRLPATVDGGLRTEAALVFHDNSSVVLTNASSTNVLDFPMQDLANVVAGDLANNGLNNGRTVRKVELRVRNNTGSDINNVDVGVFRLRAWALPRGAGSAL